MNNIKIHAVPLKILSIEIYLLNAFLSFSVKSSFLRKRFSLSSLDEKLSKKRDLLNRRTRAFIRKAFSVEAPCA